MENKLFGLEEKVQRLYDIEEIKALKGKYLRCLDTKDWAGIQETFAPGITTDYSGGKYSFDTPEAIVDFLTKSIPLRSGLRATAWLGAIGICRTIC